MTTTPRVDYAAVLALYLLEKVGTVLGEWSGKLTANEQRALFGRAIGRGKIVINGSNETICNRVKVCFGHDWDDRNVTAWRDLNPEAVMTPRAKYEALQAELAALERSTGKYLADESVDLENIPQHIAATYLNGSAPDEFWDSMHYAACSAAGMRAEEAGLDLNKLMGRSIY